MRYILILFFLFPFLNLKAQNVTYEVGLMQTSLVDSIKGVPYTKTKARQFRSVYKSVWGGSLGVKIISKPMNKKIKVKFKGADKGVKFKGKYFIHDGLLTSYSLSAKAILSDVEIYGVLADNLEIRLQYFESAYIGVIGWDYFINNTTSKSYMLNLMLPAIPNLKEFSTNGLWLILPSVKKVP